VIDLYIQQLAQWFLRCGFIINAVAERYTLRKVINHNELVMQLATSPIEETHKTAYETLNKLFNIIATAEVSASSFVGGESKIFLHSGSPMNMLYRTVVQGEPITINILTSEIDDYMLRAVLNDCVTSIFINAEPIDSLKIAYEMLSRDIVLGVQGEDTVMKSLEHNNIGMELRVRARRHRKLYEIDDYPLSDIDDWLLYDLDYVDGFDITCIKNVSGEAKMLLKAYVTEDITLLSLRKLADMDSIALAEFDNMTLADLKYIGS
jgi:hypothetical protein